MQFNNIGKGALFSEGDGTFSGNVEIEGEKIRIGGIKRTTRNTAGPGKREQAFLLPLLYRGPNPVPRDVVVTASRAEQRSTLSRRALPPPPPPARRLRTQAPGSKAGEPEVHG